MAVYIYTGKLGGGKTLCAVARIKEKLQAGCRVVTNVDIRLQSMFGRTAKAIDLVRIPDKPTIHDLNCIGSGNLSYDESKNGLLVLDECGTWFNSRNWNDKGRKPVNDWFLHARKLGWDVILIIQDISILDSQARSSIAEHTAFCRRLDRIQVPFIGSLYKMITGYRLSGPRVHSARIVYGTSSQDLLADRHVYRGSDLYNCYDTKQVFLDDYPHGVHTVLPPYYINRNAFSERGSDFYMRMTKIYCKRFTIPFALFAGSSLGVAVAFALALLFGFFDEPVQPDPIVIHQPLSEPDIIEDGSLSDDEPVNSVKVALDDRFDSYKIVSYMESSKRRYYSISNGLVTFTLDQLLAIGLEAKPVNNCELLLISGDDSYSVFADNCMPKAYSEPAYDLSQVPVIADRVSPMSLPSARPSRFAGGDGLYWR